MKAASSSESSTATHDAYTTAHASLAPEHRDTFQTQASLSSAISRKSNLNYPPQPQSASTVAIAGTRFATTGEINLDEREEFLLHQETFNCVIAGTDTQTSIILLGTLAMLTFLVSKLIWYMDGTFQTSPDNFAQIFTLHAFEGDRLFPCLWALLTHKAQPVYDRLFQIILLKCQQNNIVILVERSMSDYETGLIPALRNCNPLRGWPVQLQLDGCTFHLTQAMYRWIQLHGLVRDFSIRESDIREFFKRVAVCVTQPCVLLMVKMKKLQWL